MPDQDDGSTGPAKTSKRAGHPSVGPGSHFAGQEVAGLGLTMALAIALFAIGGNWVDERLGTGPLFVLLGAFLGFGGGFYRMYAQLVLKDRKDGGGDEAG